MPMKLPIPHQRLLGTWKSDRRRTFRNWKPSAQATPAQTRKFKSLFGRLTIRWTSKRGYSSFDNVFDKGEPYAVVACDDDSLVIRTAKPKWLGEGTELHHIYFDDDGVHYWTPLVIIEGFVEWFRRVE